MRFSVPITVTGWKSHVWIPPIAGVLSASSSKERPKIAHSNPGTSRSDSTFNQPTHTGRPFILLGASIRHPFRHDLLPLPYLPHFQYILPLTHALWTLGRCLCDIRQVRAPYSSSPVATSLPFYFVFIWACVTLSAAPRWDRSVLCICAEKVHRIPFLAVFLSYSGHSFCTFRSPLSPNPCFCPLESPSVLIAYIF